MAVTVDRPQRTDTPDSSVESGRTQPSSEDSSSSAAPHPVEPIARLTQLTPPARSWLDRCQQHLWMGGLSLLLLAALSVPIVIAPRPVATTQGASNQPSVAAVSSLPINVSITASEFKFSPASIEVPVGQKVTVTLQNSGVVLESRHLQ